MPYWFGGSAFFIFLFRQFFMTIPRELDEAAKIDGANYFQILGSDRPAALAGRSWRRSRSSRSSQHWNSFLFPLIILNDPDEVHGLDRPALVRDQPDRRRAARSTTCCWPAR